MNWLTALYAEQTAPEEIIVFLILGTASTLLIAFILYSVLLVVLTRWYIEEGVSYSLRELLLPPADRFRKNAAEYTLTIITGLLLSLTVTAKHQAVEAILAQDISAVSRDTIREALPLGDVSIQELEQAGASFDTAQRFAAWISEGVTEPVGMNAESIIQPLLKAGMNDSANLIVRALVEEIGPAAGSLLSQGLLLLASVVLLLGYVLWFGFSRWKEMQSDKVKEPMYAKIIKRLSLPAVCIPLLFVSATALDDPESIQKSAIAAVESKQDVIETPLGQAIATQAEDIRNRDRTSTGIDLEDLDRSLGSLEARLSRTTDEIATLDTALTDAQRNWAGIESGFREALAEANLHMNDVDSRLGAALDDISASDAEFDALMEDVKRAFEEIEGQMERIIQDVRDAPGSAEELAARLDSLTRNYEQLSNDQRRLFAMLEQQSSDTGSDTALVLVQNLNGNGSYTISLPGSNVFEEVRGFGTGIYALAPGTYLFSGNGAGQQRRSLQVGDVETIQLGFAVQ